VAADYTYDYAIIRVVPRVERGEMINVGIILSCPDVDFLDARVELDEARVRVLDPTLDVTWLRAHLETIPAICRGGADAADWRAGPAQPLPLARVAAQYDDPDLAGAHGSHR
jgi:hypothetical protein